MIAEQCTPKHDEYTIAANSCGVSNVSRDLAFKNCLSGPMDGDKSGGRVFASALAHSADSVWRGSAPASWSRRTAWGHGCARRCSG